jgi:hypothetical protein
MSDNALSGLISAAVAAKMTPEFIEKEVDTRVEKLLIESVNQALGMYSETGKLIKEAVADALRVDRLDLPTYGNVVAAMLRKQIEAKVAPLIAGQLAVDMDELLNLAPQELKLSAIADEMRKDRDRNKFGGHGLTVLVERHTYGSASVYLDERESYEQQDRHSCEFSMHIGEDGKILGATLRGHDLKSATSIGRNYGLGQKIRAWFACGTIIHIDEKNVSFAGDY